MLAAGIWAVSVLDEDAEKTARWLATGGHARWTASWPGSRTIPAREARSPVLDDALGAAIERRGACATAATHAILVGEVIRGQRAAAPGRRPLIHYGGRCRTLKGD